MNKSIPAIIWGSPTIKYKFKNANYIGIEEKRAVNRVLDSGILSGFVGAWVPEFYGGKEVLRLEKNWSNFENNKVSMDQISVACALEYTKFRFTDSWINDCKNLNIWLEEFNKNICNISYNYNYRYGSLNMD